MGKDSNLTENVQELMDGGILKLVKDTSTMFF